MTRDYLVVFEKAMDGWGAFPADDFGCGAMGETLEDAREQYKTMFTGYLTDIAQHGNALPEPLATSVNFEDIDPDHKTKHYVVEWLTVELPTSLSEAA